MFMSHSRIYESLLCRRRRRRHRRRCEIDRSEVVQKSRTMHHEKILPPTYPVASKVLKARVSNRREVTVYSMRNNARLRNGAKL